MRKTTILFSLIVIGLGFGQEDMLKSEACSSTLAWDVYIERYVSQNILAKQKMTLQSADNKLLQRYFYVNNLTNVTSFSNPNEQTKLSYSSNADSISKLSIGLKTAVGYNSFLKRILRDSTQQLIIGLCLKREITHLIDIEFSPAYQYFKSEFFGEGFTNVNYFDNLLIPITLKFNFFKRGSITLNWNIGPEILFELNGNWELWTGNTIYQKGKIEHLEKLFYFHTGFGGNVIVSSRVYFQIESSLGYCFTPKNLLSDYPLRLCASVMFLWK